MFPVGQLPLFAANVSWRNKRPCKILRLVQHALHVRAKFPKQIVQSRFLGFLVCRGEF